MTLVPFNMMDHNLCDMAVSLVANMEEHRRFRVRYAITFLIFSLLLAHAH